MDIGAALVAVGVVDECGTIVATTHRDTPADDPSQIEHTIIAAVRELTSEYDVEAVGIGAAGFIDAQRSTVMFAPNLAWRDEPLQAAVQLGPEAGLVGAADLARFRECAE